MRPLMYGYLRTDLAEGRIRECDAAIRKFAEQEGFDLGMVFHEFDPGRSAFRELIRELRRAESRHVVVPSMAHIWGQGKFRQALVSRLWNEAHAGVWVADLAGNQIEVKAADRRQNVSRTGTNGSGPAREISLLAGPSSAAVARLQTRIALSQWQLPSLMAPVERAVEELVSEIVHDSVHGNRPMVVRLRLESGALVVEVWDMRAGSGTGPGLDDVNRHVTALSSRCGLRHPVAGGILTWVEFDIARHTTRVDPSQAALTGS